LPDDDKDETVTETVVKQVGKIASSPAETVLKYIVVGVLILFGTVFWFSWQSNQGQPEKLYTLLEKSITQQEKTLENQSQHLRMQQESLNKLHEFTVGVRVEHQDHAAKLAVLETTTVRRMDTISQDMKTLCEDNKLLVSAIQENTAIIARWLETMETKPNQ